MIFRHYWELVRPMNAGRWFGIAPASVEVAKAALGSGLEREIVTLPRVKAA